MPFAMACQDHTGSLDFRGFVTLVRQISDHQNEVQLLGGSEGENCKITGVKSVKCQVEE